MKRQLESVKASYGALKISTKCQSTVVDANINSVEDCTEAIEVIPIQTAAGSKAAA